MFRGTPLWGVLGLERITIKAKVEIDTADDAAKE